MTYQEWINELNQIVNSEIGLDLDDLPDVPTMDAYQADETPREAFNNFARDIWELPDLSEYCTDEPEAYSDADSGL